MKISIVGTGYVGLVTGTCFAEMGNEVICIDVNEDKINRLKKGECIIYEPGLEELIEKNVAMHRLSFSTSFEESIPNSDVCFIAVGTPPLEDGSADTKYVLSAAESIAKNINKFTVIVDKSTVPIGTGFKVRDLVKSITKVPFEVVSNPEFLKEGCAINDFMRPDRVVIGTDSEVARSIMSELYSPFVPDLDKLVYTDIISAETIKYAANAMLATRISFMNEIAKLCDVIGGDVKAVRKGIGLDSRIGMPFLYASCGYGGSCFPKDVNELIQVGKRNNIDMKIVKAVEDVNFEQKHLLSKRIKDRFGDLSDKIISVWGLAFKPDTDDVRESPAVYLIKDLISLGAKIRCYDPKAMETSKIYFTENELSKIEYINDMFEVLNDSDCLVIMTEWKLWRNAELDKIISNRLKSNIVFDGRNLYDVDTMKRKGIEYHCIGRGAK